MQTFKLSVNKGLVSFRLCSWTSLAINTCMLGYVCLQLKNVLVALAMSTVFLLKTLTLVDLKLLLLLFEYKT